MGHYIKVMKKRNTGISGFGGRVFLAPMHEVNDVAFRRLAKRCGCALAFSGMTSPMTRQKINLDDSPAVQLFSTDSKGVGNFIKKYDSFVSLWDFNLGCPSKLSRKLGHGAFMHDEMAVIKEIFEVMRKATKKPCSVKLRKSERAIEIAKMAEKSGLDMVIIHPRTVEQGYGGMPDYDFAKRLKKEVSIPVCYSGNVNEENVSKVLDDFDYAMIGRAAIGRPFVFSSCTNKDPNVGFLDYLRLAKEYGLSFRQIKFQAICFTKGLRDAKKMRDRLVRAKTLDEIEGIFFSYNG